MVLPRPIQTKHIHAGIHRTTHTCIPQHTYANKYFVAYIHTYVVCIHTHIHMHVHAYTHAHIYI